MNKKMNKRFRENEEAVSPVIGVILMVAITVILAAVIGAFVFGIAPPEPAPDLHFVGVEADAGLDEITMMALGTGAVLDTELKVMVNGTHIDVGNIGPTYIHAGITVEIDTTGIANAEFGARDEVYIVIIHLPSGALMLDTSVIATE